MVAVPLINFYLAASVGQAAGTLIMIVAFVYAVSVVLKNRIRIRGHLNDAAANTSMVASRVSLQLFARTWHFFALTYFLMVFVFDTDASWRCTAFRAFCNTENIGCGGDRASGIDFPDPNDWASHSLVGRFAS